jgi:hypothetical protein
MKRHPFYRRNPARPVIDLEAMEVMFGDDDAYMDDLYADPVYAAEEIAKIQEKINAAWDKYEAAAAARDAAQSGPLTDRQAWNMLAGLVDEVGTSWPSELKDALKKLFREEASKS